jgi:hypothetical protein
MKKIQQNTSLIFILALLTWCFACGQTVPAFDGNQAFAYLTAQTDFGPRNPGSEGHKKCLDYLVTELKKYADLVNAQQFTFNDTINKVSFEMTNIIASFNLNPKNGRRILFLAHWDTRPRAEEDPNKANRNTPLLGANDGASGVAVLLEIASVLKKYPPKIGVDILLVDGEDYGDYRVNGLDYYFLGSRYFTKTMGTYKPEFAVLLDMVGSKNAQFYMEGNSLDYGRDIVMRIWSKAEKSGFKAFVSKQGTSISDDHIIFNQAGISSVDIIDINQYNINYAQWHTIADTPEQCSASTLAIVGTLVLSIIYE